MTWNWPEIAAFAYGSYLDHGKGAVLLGKDFSYITDIESRFSNEDICEKIDLRIKLDDYNPNKEVVLVEAKGDLILRSHKIYAGGPYTPACEYSASLQAPSLGWRTESGHEMSFRYSNKRKRRR